MSVAAQSISPRNRNEETGRPPQMSEEQMVEVIKGLNADDVVALWLYPLDQFEYIQDEFRREDVILTSRQVTYSLHGKPMKGSVAAISIFDPDDPDTSGPGFTEESDWSCEISVSLEDPEDDDEAHFSFPFEFPSIWAIQVLDSPPQDWQSIECEDVAISTSSHRKVAHLETVFEMASTYYRGSEYEVLLEFNRESAVAIRDHLNAFIDATAESDDAP